MEEFPANSKMPEKTDEPRKDEKRVERVTINEAEIRPPKLSKRMREAFAGDDSRSVMDYVVIDVLIPAAKDTFVDAVTQGLERLVFGQTRTTTRRAASSRGSGYVSYNRIAPSRSSIAPRDESRPVVSRQARATHDFDEILIKTRAEAEQVLDRLYDLVNKYDSATVADFYDLVGVTGEYTDNKWGWTNLEHSRVVRVRDGYVLDLPKPSPVE